MRLFFRMRVKKLLIVDLFKFIVPGTAIWVGENINYNRLLETAGLSHLLYFLKATTLICGGGGWALKVLFLWILLDLMIVYIIIFLLYSRSSCSPILLLLNHGCVGSLDWVILCLYFLTGSIELSQCTEPLLIQRVLVPTLPPSDYLDGSLRRSCRLSYFKIHLFSLVVLEIFLMVYNTKIQVKSELFLA